MKRENYIIKSTQLNFYHGVFCVNKDQKPSGQNMGIMATAHNEYCLK
jgi:hypothetical protein